MKDGHLIQTEELGRSLLNGMSEENYGSRPYGQNMSNGESSVWDACHGDHAQCAIIALFTVVSIRFSFIEIMYKKLDSSLKGFDSNTECSTTAICLFFNC